MTISDLDDLDGRSYPARRTTKNIAGGAAPIEADGFCMGTATLEPNGGQVPWHNHPQEEVYVILEGEGEMCIGDERQTLSAGQSVYIPPHAYHQLSNTSDAPLEMLYCYAPPGDVDHWKQELAGTLPEAGAGDVPPLPEGAHPQHTEPPARDA
jgi:mannose-6-phosphate isomerase-like protein (cupin superfamily)